MIRRCFRTLRKFIAPTWLTEEEGEKVGYSLDLLKDGSVRRLELGLLARFPQNGPNGETAPPDALQALSRDRRVVRGIDETAASFAYRLTQWLVDRRTAGAAFTLLKQLAAYCDWDGSKGCSFRTVDNRGNWYSRSATGVETHSLNTGNWDWDGETARWSRFWVIIYPGTRWTESAYDWGDSTGPDWGEAPKGTIGSTMTPEHVTMLRAIIDDWKPEHARCKNIILAFDPASFDPSAPEPDGLWSRWSKNVGGVQVPARLDTARYLDGV